MPRAASTVDDAIAAQAAQCDSIGSPLYASLLRGLLLDHRGGGLTAELLDGVSTEPVHDAIPLRYLATGHRLALLGAAPVLAEQYPSCGGRWTGDADVVAAFLATVHANRAQFVAGLRRNVQTNEVGRAAVLASGMSWIAAQHGLPIDQLEIGSSAGLLSRWDRFGFDTGSVRAGNSRSPVQFGPEWWVPPAPVLAAWPQIVRRRASDVSPIDVGTDAGTATILSFIWPDQLLRIARLRAALAVAATVPLEVETGDAGDWLGDQLRDWPRADDSPAVTVVFHTIVWQYLPQSTRDALCHALMTAGAAATTVRPLCWLRMEPAARTHADLRVTTWPGGEEIHLADVGYHGADIRWCAPAR